ncbi:YlxR family protein [Herbihabitans rhizosphaerae]|uniref:YlxR family protein n=1 Tax=Herbihabitans rhizosphaerae TaxID=1872711 RepID=UPI001F5EB164
MDSRLQVDPRRRLPGRGAWIHPDPDCLRLAERRRAFPRALRVQGPLEIDAVRTWLEQATREAPASGKTGKQVDPS